MPLTVHETERVAQRELLSVLRLVDTAKGAVSDKTRRPSAATVKAITSILDGGDFYPVLPVTGKWHDENAGPIRAFAWPLIVQAGGLAKLSGTRLELTRTGRKALSQPPFEILRQLWDKWIGTTLIDELDRVECADPALAALIANDSRTRRYCMRAGETHLVVPSEGEAAFKRALREIGYLLAMEEIRPAKSRRKAASGKTKRRSTGA